MSAHSTPSTLKNIKVARPVHRRLKAYTSRRGLKLTAGAEKAITAGLAVLKAQETAGAK
jgi:hypothetical protein